eukprot:6471233-Amphidinium_carterae.3
MPRNKDDRVQKDKKERAKMVKRSSTGTDLVSESEMGTPVHATAWQAHEKQGAHLSTLEESNRSLADKIKKLLVLAMHLACMPIAQLSSPPMYLSRLTMVSRAGPGTSGRREASEHN